MQKTFSPEDTVLITGCGGMLGEAVYEVFSKKFKNTFATDIDLNEPWLRELDVREINQCEKVFAERKPSLVLHLAALTDLEVCEKDPENAWKTNALGTENIALLAEKYQSTLVYISTAGVFDGLKDVYTDFDLPRPINVYGTSKYHGELFVQQHVSRYYIFRAGWMMGGGPSKDKKFINKIFKQLEAGAKTLYVVDDKLGTPTYTFDFASGIAGVLPTGYYGLYHQVCSGGTSRYEVACEFVKLLGLEGSVKVKRVDSSYFQKDFFAPRPPSEKLLNLKLNSRNLNIMRDWKVCLEEYSTVFKKSLATGKQVYQTL